MSENGPYQHSRTATIETPLPLNTLVLRKFRYEDRLNRPFRIEADLLSDRASIPFEEIVGKRVRIRMQTRAGERLCHAVVASFDTCGMVDDLFAYRAVLVPWLWLLGRSADCRIFQGLSVPEIVSEILKENGFDEFELRIDEIDYPKLEYCVQYRETALNFVQRLLESEGIAYYFRHTETEAVLVLTDDPAAHDFAPGYEDVEFRQLTGGDTRTEHVHAWTVRRQVVPERFVTRDFDPVVPRQDFTHIGSTPDLDAVAMGSIYDYPGSVITRTQPGADKAKKKKGGNDRISHYHVERIAKVRLQEQQSAHKVAYAESTVRGFAAGVKFQLEGALRNEDDRPYLLTSVIMEWDAGHFRSGQAPQETFRCSTTAVDAELFWRPTRETPRPIIHGAQTAIVVGPKGEEIYVDQFGRVKVQFHWDRHHPDRDYNSSCWLRTSHPWAGKGFGGMAIPRIGQEVIVEFLEGDPDRPIINGRVYNGDSMPHASNSGRDGKPGNTKPDGIEQAAMMTSFKSNSLGGSGGSNEITMNDAAGAEGLFIKAQKDETHMVGNDREDTVSNNETLKVGVDRSREVGNNETVNVGVNATETVGAAKIVDVGTTLLLKAGVSITLQCGASTLHMNAAGIITVSGLMITVAGSAMATVTAPIANVAGVLVTSSGVVNMVSGGALTNVAGGVTRVVADNANVIKGATVYINT